MTLYPVNPMLGAMAGIESIGDQKEPPLFDLLISFIADILANLVDFAKGTISSLRNRVSLVDQDRVNPGIELKKIHSPLPKTVLPVPVDESNTVITEVDDDDDKDIFYDAKEYNLIQEFEKFLSILWPVVLGGTDIVCDIDREGNVFMQFTARPALKQLIEASKFFLAKLPDVHVNTDNEDHIFIELSSILFPLLKSVMPFLGSGKTVEMKNEKRGLAFFVPHDRTQHLLRHREVTTTEAEISVVKQILSLVGRLYSSEVRELLSNLWTCILQGSNLSIQVDSDKALKIQFDISPELIDFLLSIMPILSENGITIQMNDHTVTVATKALPQWLTRIIAVIIGTQSCNVTWQKEEKKISLDFGGEYQASMTKEALNRMRNKKVSDKSGVERALCPGLLSSGWYIAKRGVLGFSINLAEAYVEMPKLLDGTISVDTEKLSINFADKQVVAKLPCWFGWRGNTELDFDVQSVGLEGNKLVLKMRPYTQENFWSSWIWQEIVNTAASSLGRKEKDGQGRDIIVMEVDLVKGDSTPIGSLMQELFNAGQLFQRKETT